MLLKQIQASTVVGAAQGTVGAYLVVTVAHVGLLLRALETCCA